MVWWPEKAARKLGGPGKDSVVEFVPAECAQVNDFALVVDVPITSYFDISLNYRLKDVISSR